MFMQYGAQKRVTCEELKIIQDTEAGVEGLKPCVIQG
jgi:hypothetical protein